MNKFTLMIRQSFPTREWRALEYIVFFVLISAIVGVYYVLFNPNILYTAMDNNINTPQSVINKEPSCVKKLIILDQKLGNNITFSDITRFKEKCNGGVINKSN